MWRAHDGHSLSRSRSAHAVRTSTGTWNARWTASRMRPVLRRSESGAEVEQRRQPGEDGLIDEAADAPRGVVKLEGVEAGRERRQHERPGRGIHARLAQEHAARVDPDDAGEESGRRLALGPAGRAAGGEHEVKR